MEAEKKYTILFRSKKSLCDVKSGKVSINGEGIRVSVENNPKGKIMLEDIAGLIVSTTKEIIQVYTKKPDDDPEVQLMIKWYDRKEFIKELTKYKSPLPVWFTVEQDLTEFYKGAGGETFFEQDKEKNTYWGGLDEK